MVKRNVEDAKNEMRKASGEGDRVWGNSLSLHPIRVLSILIIIIIIII